MKVARYAISVACLLASVSAPLTLSAQGDGTASVIPQTDALEQTAPPVSTRIARLTFLAGEVHVQRADNTGEDGAVLNLPLHEGTRVLAGDDGRAEIEFEDGSLARITPGSGLSLDSLALDGNIAKTRVTLLGGTGYFELRAVQGFSYTVQAGGLNLTPIENTTFRVLLAGDAPPEVTVLSGTARVESPEHFHVDVRAGESIRVDASDAARYFLDGTYTEGNWDWWNEERDQAASDEAAKATAARTDLAGSQGYGWADMDANGSWYDVPGLGMVWQPEAADESFDPYGFGDWVYESGSYTFVSGYAWGWTPFHCGRWSWGAGFGWGWSAGPECGRWGFGGRHGIVLGGVPGHYRRPEPPPLGGRVHRLVAVRSPDGARPPILAHGGPVLFNGRRLEALRPIGSSYTPRGGSAAGRALLRDFPLNHAQPVLGAEPGTARAVSTQLPGWHKERSRPGQAVTGPGSSGGPIDRLDGTIQSPEQGTGRDRTHTGAITDAPGRPRTASPANPVTGAAVNGSHREPLGEPVQRPGHDPVRKPRIPTVTVPTIAPVPAPRPAPAPAPVRIAPPPPAPSRSAPQPAPAPAQTIRIEPVKPK